MTSNRENYNQIYLQTTLKIIALMDLKMSLALIKVLTLGLRNKLKARLVA